MLTKKEILDTAIELCENDNLEGLCIACGYIQDGCELDAENYECEDCGRHEVFGAELLLMYFS